MERKSKEIEEQGKVNEKNKIKGNRKREREKRIHKEILCHHKEKYTMEKNE